VQIRLKDKEIEELSKLSIYKDKSMELSNQIESLEEKLSLSKNDIEDRDKSILICKEEIDKLTNELNSKSNLTSEDEINYKSRIADLETQLKELYSQLTDMNTAHAKEIENKIKQTEE